MQYFKTCPQCGKDFIANIDKRRYCSHQCANIAVHSKPNTKSIFTCEWCGKTFVEWAYRKPKFCSRQCNNESAAHKPKPKQKAKKKTINLICTWCNKSYTTSLSQNSNGRVSKFCSVECRGKHFSATNRGSNHPNWRGGGHYPTRGRNWSAQRRRTLERDNYTCQSCGKTKMKRSPDVHHIKPYRQFNGDYIAANNLLNLITLCRPCHKKIEHGTLPCPKPKP